MDPSIMDFLDNGTASTDNINALDNNYNNTTNLSISSTSTVFSWCEKCSQQAQEIEMRHKKSIGIIKKKIIFTDDLIGMYTDAKAALEQSRMQIKTLEMECKRRETDNQLINKQLKAILAESNPAEIELQKEEINFLKNVIENLQDQINSFDVTRKMWDDKIAELKEEQSSKEGDSKKNQREKESLQKEMAKLKKQLLSLEKENHALEKKNQLLQERCRKRRSRGSGSFSYTTDSEHNTSATKDDAKVENKAPATSDAFKSPLPGKKKKLKRKRRKSRLTSASDDDDNIPTVQTDSINEEALPLQDELSQRIETESSEKDATRQMKANWLSSSSDTATDSVKPMVATSDMKARLLETKRKRAYRSFCNHPSSVQLKELSEIVDRMKKKEVVLEDEINQFCSKHFLTGHESYVVKKIEKLHKNSMTKEMLDLLDRLNFGDTNQNPNKLKEKNSNDTAIQTATDLDDSMASSIDDFVPVSDEIQPPSPKARESTAIISQSENTQSHASAIVSSRIQNAVAKDASSLLKEIPTVHPSPKSVLEVNNVGKKDNGKNSFEKCTETNKEAPKPTRKTLVSIFSSDDNEEEPVKVNIHSISDWHDNSLFNSSLKSAPAPKTVSDSSPLKETILNDKLHEKSGDPEIRFKTNETAPTRKVIESEQNQHTNRPERNGKISNIVTHQKKNEQKASDAKLHQNSKEISLPHQNVETELRERTSELEPNLKTNDVESNDESNEISYQKRTVQPKTLGRIVEASKAENKITKKTVEKSIPAIRIDQVSTKRRQMKSPTELPSKISKLSEQKSVEHPNPVATSFKLPEKRVLTSLQSLPFSVDNDSVAVSPKAGVESSYSFLPTAAQIMDELSDDDSSAGETDLMADMIDSLLSPSSLNNMLSDMTALMSFKPLSPFKTSDADLLSPLSDFEDDNRMSISPSANLCTAISFSSNVSETKSQEDADKLKQAVNISSTTIIEESGISTTTLLEKDALPLPNVGDAPRRFSCEAPVLARSVPTVKRVCKTQSLDPTALSRLESSHSSVNTAPVSSATPTISIQSEASTSKILPSNVKIGKRDSGPFKIVGSPGATPSVTPTTGFSQPQKVVTDSETLLRPVMKYVDPLLLQEINAYAVVRSEKYPILNQNTVMKWVCHIMKVCNNHVTHESVARYFLSNDDPSSINIKHVVHNAEHEFVRMVMAVNEVRSEIRQEFVKQLVLPTILKLLCKYGNQVFSNNLIVFSEYSASSDFQSLLFNDKLSDGSTCVLIRLLATFCRIVGYAKAALDFCRYAMLLKAPSSVELLLYDCIACYPDAFSKSFPLSGKILIHSLSLQAEQYRYSAKSEEFKDGIRNRVRQLEVLLGWTEAYHSVQSSRVSQEQDPGLAIASNEEKTMLVFGQCLKAIFNAELVPAVDMKNRKSPFEILALSVENINDVFTALELLAGIKGLTFAKAEIIDKKFWPWLNTWTRHVAKPNENASSVSDACVIAVLHGVSVILTAVVMRQKVHHPSQSISTKVFPYFNTLLQLLTNFAARHIKSAPFRVQCATAVTILKLGFFNPLQAYTVVHDWLCASLIFADQDEDTELKAHPLLPHMVALCSEKTMRRTVMWLETQTKYQRKKKGSSLTQILWG